MPLKKKAKKDTDRVSPNVPFTTHITKSGKLIHFQKIAAPQLVSHPTPSVGPYSTVLKPQKNNNARKKPAISSSEKPAPLTQAPIKNPTPPNPDPPILSKRKRTDTVRQLPVSFKLPVPPKKKAKKDTDRVSPITFEKPKSVTQHAESSKSDIQLNFTPKAPSAKKKHSSFYASDSESATPSDRKSQPKSPNHDTSDDAQESPAAAPASFKKVTPKVPVIPSSPSLGLSARNFVTATPVASLNSSEPDFSGEIPIVADPKLSSRKEVNLGTSTPQINLTTVSSDEESSELSEDLVDEDSEEDGDDLVRNVFSSNEEVVISDDELDSIPNKDNDRAMPEPILKPKRTTRDGDFSESIEYSTPPPLSFGDKSSKLEESESSNDDMEQDCDEPIPDGQFELSQIDFDESSLPLNSDGGLTTFSGPVPSISSNSR